MKFRFHLIALLALSANINGHAAETNAPAKPEPTFDVRIYHVEGNTVLPRGILMSSAIPTGRRRNSTC